MSSCQDAALAETGQVRAVPDRLAKSLLRHSDLFEPAHGEAPNGNYLWMHVENDKLRGEVANLARFVEEARKERDEARVLASEALGDANQARAEVYRLAHDLGVARAAIADLEEEVATMRCDDPAPAGDADEFVSLIESLVLARMLKHKQRALLRE